GGAAGLGLGKEIVAFAEKIGAVIGCSFMGLSAIPQECERFLGMQGMHGHYASSMAQNESDLIIGLGVRFSDRATGNVAKFAKQSKIIQLDPDSAEINKNVRVDLGIVGDMEDAFKRIAERCEEKENIDWLLRVNELKKEEEGFEEEIAAAAKVPLTPRQVFDEINKAKPPKTIIATDVGQHQMWAAQYTVFDGPRRFVSSGGLGTMGFGLGAAIGAYVATKDPVVLITGDGSFGMNLNELATAVSYKIPVVIVLMNNGVLGMVRQWQTLFFGKRYSETVLGRKTDFVALAKAFGAEGVLAETQVEFKKAFEEALKAGKPTVIDVRIDKDELVLPMLPPGGAISDIITKV
ncbi:MAG: acetolactate synthase large subunit, partial [Clostridia bacterium]|nr:acetolactate synthase large subunit [Clostridia bacterium]